MYKLRVYSSILGLILCCASCAPDERMRNTQEPPSVEVVFPTTAQDHPQEIVSPIAGVELTYQSSHWIAQEGATLNLAGGTQLNIPKDAVIDAEGDQVSGRITLKFRQFSDISEILLSGLSLNFDSVGLHKFFRSTGMLEVRASKNGEPLFIAPNKSIKMVMPTQNQGVSDLYRYDEEDHRWKFVLSRQAHKQIDPTAKRKKLPAPPIKPEKIRPTDMLFNYDVPYDQFEELQAYFGLKWVYAGLARSGSIDPEKEVWVMKERWPAVTLTAYNRRKGLYTLNLKNSDQQIKVIVRPVMEGLEYDVAMVQYIKEKKEYDELKAEFDREQAILASQATMTRSCEISAFGYYNWDLPIEQNEFGMVEANFKAAITGQGNPDIDFSMVYLVLPKEKTVVAYPRDQWKQFRYMKSAKNQVFAIAPGDTVYLLDSQSFDQAKGKAIHTFSLTKVEQKISSVEDLKNLLNTTM